MHLNVVVFLITDIRVNEEGVEDIETLLGMVVHSEDEAYKLYNDYAIRIGFSVQKEKIRYAKNVVRQRDYVCSKEDSHEIVTIWMIRSSKNYKLGPVVKLVSDLQ